MIKICVFLMVSSLVFSQDYWKAEDYYYNSSSQKEAASDLMKYVSLRGNEKVLDVGCGDGKISAEIAQKLTRGTLVGIDVSPSMVDFAKNSFVFPNLCFFLQDAQNLDFIKEFDLICSFTTLQWVQSHEAFLQGAYASLKSSGILAVTMPMGLPDSLQQAVLEVVESAQWNSYFKDFSTGWNFVSEDQYMKLLETQGFTIQRCCAVPQKDVFPSRVVFERFIGQWFPYLRPLPIDLQPNFLREVIDRFLSLEEPFPSGEVHFKIRRLEVVSVKEEFRAFSLD